MLVSKPVRLVGCAAAVIMGVCAAQALAAERVIGAVGNAAVQPVVKHSAPYTRLLGTAWPKGPVKFADHSTTSGAENASSPAKTPAQTVGWHHRPYYAGYAPYTGPYPYAYGPRMAAPYNVGYPYGAWNYYTPYAYSYTPWVGGWGGYPYYTGYTPGFGGYYSVGYRGPGAYYGNYGGCCYW